MFDEPEDIFGQTDPVSQGQNQPSPLQQTQPTGLPLDDELPQRVTGSRKVVVVAVIVIILIIVTAASLFLIWYLRQNQVAPAQTDTTNALNTQQADELTPLAPNNQQLDQTLPEVVEEPVSVQPITLDQDGDGLTDEEEQALGTNIAQTDTDQDGLTDAEEVNVWNTDPLNPDTDGDTYLDGAEVDNGYDPNQAGGVLLNLDNQS